MPRHDRSEARSLGPLSVVLAIGAVLTGGIIATQRRSSQQRRRVASYPDDAPAPTRRSPEGRGAVVARSVMIARPRSELYAFWRDFRNLPRFMENVRAVTPSANGRVVWTIGAPFGTSVDIETEITEEREGEFIAWRSVEGSDVATEGSVRFTDAPAGRGAVVEATMRYRPPAGEVGRWIAKLLRREPAIQARHELKRFKMLMETGEIATSRNRKEEAATAA